MHSIQTKNLKQILCGSIFAAFVFFNLQVNAAGDPAKGAEIFKQCQACHQAGPNAKNAFGPVLNNIVGRKAASYPGYTYSASLNKASANGLVWSEDEIFEWLAGPSKYLQKILKDPEASSKMPVNFADPQVRHDVIAHLKTLKTSIAAGHDKGMEHAAAPSITAIATPLPSSEDPAAGLPIVKLELVKPPFLPKHDQKAVGGPKLVEVELAVEEKKNWKLDDNGTAIVALTYNGSMPGPAIVAHEGDYIKLTLKNLSTNSMQHNIDLHAVTGALGGAALTTLNPGEEVTIQFKATKAGSFLYHCAPEGSMTPYHVTHGMSGMILILPRNGLVDDKGNSLTYDRAYYIGENDFYVSRDSNGQYKRYENAGDDFTDWVKTMRTLLPSHLLFNGHAGALVGDNAMKAKVGETVAFFHVQANRDTRPHIIGGHGDFVWETGSLNSPPIKDQQTWLVRGGAVGTAIYTFRQPGVYVYVNHNLIEAVELGAAGHVVVEGPWDHDLLRVVK